VALATNRYGVPVFRLVAEDTTVVLSEDQVTRIQFWLLETLPAWRCDVTVGPGAVITVPDDDLRFDDIPPTVLRKLEAIAGCSLTPG
jgi:hypothetical protein